MDRFNSQVRAMFDMIGSNLNALGKQLTGGPADGKTKQAKMKGTTKQRNVSKTSVKTTKTVASKQSVPKTTSTIAAPRQTANVSPMPLAPFAPRLLPVAEAYARAEDGVESDWSNVKSMAASQASCAAYLIHCVQHQKVALTQANEKQATWMPFMAVPGNRSWEDAGLAGLLITLSNANMEVFLELKEQPLITTKHLLEVFDVQLPHTLDIISRLTWYVRLDTRLAKTTYFKCCRDTAELKWVKESDITQQTPAILEYMWGIELVEKMAVVLAAGRNGDTPSTTFEEYSLAMALQFVPQQPPANAEQQLLSSANLSEKDIERLYADFLEHCFPSTAMAPHSFRVYMTKYGVAYNDERLWAFFRAFNYSGTGVVTFPELLLGLACIDCKSIHNETRTKFVIRYYDVFKRGHLTEDDLRLMIQDINGTVPLTEQAMAEKLARLLTDVEAETDPATGKMQVPLQKFLVGVGKHKIRGTAKLCRIGRPICALISRAIFARATRKNTKSSRQLGSVIERQHAGMCLGCLGKRPALENSLAKLAVDGTFQGMDQMPQLNDDSLSSTTSASATSSSTTPQSLERKKKSTQKASLPSLPSAERVTDGVATPTVDDKALAVAHNLLKLIRQFAPSMGDTSNPAGLLADGHSESLLEQLKVIEEALVPLLTPTRPVSVASPAIVIGDIHGNLADLLSLEKSLWKRFPLAGPSLVFLGDIVDRGKWGLECAIYVFCLQLLAPHSVTFLRGNHEVRELQCHYTYRRECLQKHGDHWGTRLWKATNRIFDRLPLCAVIDEAIYCAHGGIPRSATRLEDLATLPATLPSPQQQSDVAWEILWSDPMSQTQFVEMARLQCVDLAQCDGFLANQKRGTAWAFNEDALDRFLATNGLTHVVRAHEVPLNGFSFHFGRKCTTIFSCSHYCGNDNCCGVLFVDRQQLRVVRIDTDNNASATD